uniref:isoleucine--tRNA ligase n=2 Tax=Dunaliella tertiolecta TaxID=3047 RepID=A0A7S3R0N5_DUNTE|mmetsp:Transcript_14527/g.39310  ORF Transcript_14527/g.39310 Transcript_14527/m.39310 type:complete len:1229 (-) Transcript_14527:109-3795(-)
MKDVEEGKNFSFPKEEERTLEFWKQTDAFHEQLRRSEGKPEYIFYDGPPFATGLPHYGHILAGTIKDIVTRYASQNGHHVSRRFGWDCHGLPVEQETEKLLNLKGRSDIFALGIDKFNEECRSIVMRFASEWEKTVTRLGRWIDFKNDYKTLDPSFMESVWWVFSQLYAKGLVYKGLKVMPVSTGCATTLANFEAGQNYKQVDDPAVMVSFPIKGDPDGASFIAWTTTPWTLPSNLALCVNAELTYVKVKDPVRDKVFIVAQSRLPFMPGAVPKESKGKGKGQDKDGKEGEKAPKAGWQVLSTCPGSELVGLQYEPLFPYFKNHASAFRVLADKYVSDDSGTGVVHQSPGHGEDDYRVCMAHGVIVKGGPLPCPVDLEGKFMSVITDFAGKYVKEADKEIIASVKAMGRLVDASRINHSYPFCWRSDTPLVQLACPAWFVSVEPLKERLLENNKMTYWVPEHVRDKRFHNWLEGARDWCISRSRFWGTPLPIWVSEDGEERVVVGSIAELEQLTGAKITDLHRHFIDHLTIPSRQGKGTLRRVDDVFDCWFESGSMPYAQQHYPFENKQLFESCFPADFVAEGVDQTRGWFYTLMVLATALFDKPAFKNLVCNGLVLASDGKKMSKRLKNYPDPSLVISKYGADALRLYLINSPVVRADNLAFQEAGVFAVVKDVFLPWYNAYRFLVQNVIRLEVEVGTKFKMGAVDLDKASNVLDRWIAASSRNLTQYVRQEMGAYRLYTVVPFLVKFIDNLTNIYVRYNRKRLKGGKGTEDCMYALSSLCAVLINVCKCMAPFTPFLTEHMYQNLRDAIPEAEALPSVHFCDVPPVVPEHPGDARIRQSVARMQAVIELGRKIRERGLKPIKTPLRKLVVVHPDTEFLSDVQGELLEYVTSELNVREVECCADPLKYATLRAEPDFQALGKRLGPAMKAVCTEVKAMSSEAVLAMQEAGFVEVAGLRLEASDIKVKRDYRTPEGMNASEVDADSDGDVLAVLDLRVDSELTSAGLAREVVNRFQKLRKKAGVTPLDPVEFFYDTSLPSSSSEGTATTAAPANAAAKASSKQQQQQQQQQSNAAETQGAAGTSGRTAESEGGLPALVRVHAQYLQESLGGPLLPASCRPPGAVVLATEWVNVGSEDDGSTLKFTAVLSTPGVTVDQSAVCAACGGDTQLAEAVTVYMHARDPAKLQAQAASGGGTIKATVDGKAVQLSLGKHIFPSAAARALGQRSS